MRPAQPPPPPSYAGSVTEILDIGGGLWGVRLRLPDGSLHQVVLPENSINARSLRISVAAIIALMKLNKGV